jgi:uncharacterized membrane-anchored protein YhcB (DUF1043 family)
MNATSWLFYLGVAIASIIGAFLGAFIKRIGEDFAARQSIQKLTATVENIKAAISDDVWDRQKQWEMRRDSIFDAVRVLTIFDNALIKLNSTFSIKVNENSDTAARRDQLIGEAYLRYAECCSDYQCANRILDLVVGGKVSNNFRNYFQFTASLVQNMNNDQRFLASPGTTKELEEKSDAFIQSAREVLGIKDADESLLSRVIN